MARISKREALGVPTKQRLVQLSRQFDLYSISTAQPKSDHVDALSRSRRASFENILGLLSRSELKAMCRRFGIDDSGKAKAEIAARLWDEPLSTQKTTNNIQRTIRSPLKGTPRSEAVANTRQATARKHDFLEVQ